MTEQDKQPKPRKKLYPGQRPPNWVGPDGVVRDAKMRPLAKVALGAGIVVWAGVVGTAVTLNSKPSPDAASPTAQASGDPASAPSDSSGDCGIGGKATRLDYLVRSEQTMLSEPEASAPPVIWDTGSGRVPTPVEEGKTVREQCRKGQWSLVNVVSTTELHRLRGWVPSASLRDVPRTPDGRRVYELGDIKWPEGSSRFRPAVVKIINRIMKDRPDCQAMDTDNLVLNGSTFSIPCFTGGDMASFDFTAADAVVERSFKPVSPIEKRLAVEACKSAILSRLNHPSTVSFPTFDYDQRDGGNGDTELLMSFKAKNGFGLELSYDVSCRFHGDSLMDIAMSEAEQP